MRSTLTPMPPSAPWTPCAPPALQLKLDPRQIVVISGEPYEGYEFTDEHATGIPYRWAVLGAAVGGTCGFLLTTLSQKSYPILTGGMSLTPAWTNGIIVYEMIMLGAILTTLVVLLDRRRTTQFQRRDYRSRDLEREDTGRGSGRAGKFPARTGEASAPGRRFASEAICLRKS